jgi:hypothetical protein
MSDKVIHFSQEEIESDPVLYGMKRDSIPFTRENYIIRNWGDEPEPWSAELEAELPEAMQDWDRFEEKE